MINLTDEQRAIVAHDSGPALVFAVAGSGKTTSVIYRIERLVRQKVFNPHSILATSFGRRTVAEIRKRLDEWPHCGPVQVSTLHSLGNQILRLAQKRGHLDNLQLNEGEDGHQATRIGYTLLYRTIDAARRLAVPYLDELRNFDHEDFLTFVGISKGNLRYANLANVNLPDSALSVATQAVPPANHLWYLPFYQLYEQMRVEQGWVTFDDMLMTGWEILVRHPAVLSEIQGRFQCVMVDEYQDVNLAQVELLDFTTQPHRNYMAIGDDDQTIYEWRGAHPTYILQFTNRYDARKYLLSENFRSRASHVALANKVIVHNKRREPKHLVLTQGFDGATLVHFDDSDEQMGRNVVAEIQTGLQAGFVPDDFVVLVRLYAQTPYIEQFLIENRIPYKVVGNLPFYQRSEVVSLINYIRVALVEQDLLGGKQLDDECLSRLTECWPDIYKRPNRFISRETADQVLQAVSFHNAPISRSLLVAKAGVSQRVADRMAQFATDLKWLASVLDSRPACEVLQELEARLGYKDFLRRNSGFPETGEGKAATVDAFIGYAQHKGTLREFLQHLEYISFQRIGRNLEDEKGLITLMTIFRAKGDQWPVVFVPNCNEGTIPFHPITPERLEEERRLFYVAITRPRKQLHLHILKTQPTSPFLCEAEFQETLNAVGQIKAALERDPSEWRSKESVSVAKYMQEFHFDRYFKSWWSAAAEVKQKIGRKIQRLFGFTQEKQLNSTLGLDESHASVWNDVPCGKDHEDVDEGEFSDLEQLAAKRAEGRRDIAKPTITREFPASPSPSPEVVSSGTTDCVTPVRSFRMGDRVRHAKYGVGTIERVVGDGDDQLVTIKFTGSDTKTTHIRYANLELIESPRRV